MSKKTLTARDVLDVGGAVTDELLEPFVSGNSDSERNDSRQRLREAVAGSMSFFSRQSTEDKEKEIDLPIISIGGESTSKESTNKRTTNRTRKGRKK